MPEPVEEGIVIDDTPVVEEKNEPPAEFEIEGLTDGEIKLAKEHGLYKEKKDGENEKQPDAKTDSDKGEKPEEKEVEVETPTFEQVEENEKLIDKYSKNEKALFWKWKTDKHKRQEAQKKATDLEAKLKEAVDSGASTAKIKKIQDLLKNPDSLTIEALAAVIDEKIEPEKKSNELDNAQAIQQKVALKAQFAEKIGSAKYDNFDAISNLAKEIIKSDKSNTYQKLIDESFLNDEVDENMLVERVVSIARMSPKFNETVNQVSPEKKEEVSRVLDNSKKKINSASLSGASGKRIISESELTVDQATKLSTEQWNKLKPSTRERILKGINP
jgi:hypothetical protein